MKNNLYRRMIYLLYHSKADFVSIRWSFLIVFILFQIPVSASELPLQDIKISIQHKNVALGTVFNDIESKTSYSFLVRNNDVNLKQIVSIDAKNKTVREILAMLFAGTDLKYEVENKRITVYRPIKKAQKSDKRKVTGRIIDETGSPVIGASVQNKKSGMGSITDLDGIFSLDISENSTILSISYLGYENKEIQVKEQSDLGIIKLAPSSMALEEVVVVGYGVQKKESLTGAIYNLKSSDIIKTKSPSLAQVIQGKVSGLRIRQQNGEPGKFSSDINLRGLGNPLFIIDGVVRDGSSEFQRLNPEDIENISFLKDATAAIYGMNSANGAIIVTTKKGALGKPRITVNANAGISSPTDVPKMANAAQYMTIRNEAELNAGRPGYITPEELAKWQQGAPGYQSTDLYDAVFNDVATQYQATLSLEGGTEKMTYYGSLGYSTDNSLLKNRALTYDKFTLRSNVSLKITDNLTASMNIGGRYDITDRPWLSFFDIFKGTRINPPTSTIYANGNPNYYNNFSYQANPAAISDKDYSGYGLEKNKNLQTQFSLEYSVPYVKGLKAKASFVYDYNNYTYKGVRKGLRTYTYGEYTGEYTPTDAYLPALIQANNKESERMDMQLQLSYDRTFKDHHLSATYVFESREEKANWTNGERKFDFYAIDELDYGRAADQLVSGSSDHQAFLSHIGRLTYDYKGKYLAEAAFRYDGSYRYAPENRWAFFPSGSIGWRISEEDFIKDNFTFIDNLKLRAFAGLSGQDAGDPFQYIAGCGLNNGGYSFSAGKYTNGVSSPVMINQNLTWIKINMFNVGVDFSIFNRLFSVEFDLYQRTRSGLLANRYGSLPNTFGASLPQENLNGDRTQGIEFSLSHEKTFRDFHYVISGNFNLARTKNRHIERGPFTSSWDQWKNKASGRWNDFIWGYQVDGRFQNEDQIATSPIQNGDNGNSKELPGDYILKDLNGDGVVNDMDKVPLFWSSSPLIHFGFNVQANWKNFDFYALFQGSALYTVQFNEVYATMLYLKGGNFPEYFFDRWHREDPYDANSKWIPGKWPAARLEQDMGALYTRDSEIWRKDASYLRLKSVEIGYTFDSKLLKNVGIDKLRLYINGYNLLTFCDPFVKAFDPEKIEGDYNAGLNYPLNRTFNFGLTMNF